MKRREEGGEQLQKSSSYRTRRASGSLFLGIKEDRPEIFFVQKKTVMRSSCSYIRRRPSGNHLLRTKGRQRSSSQRRRRPLGEEGRQEVFLVEKKAVRRSSSQRRRKALGDLLRREEESRQKVFFVENKKAATRSSSLRRKRPLGDLLR